MPNPKSGYGKEARVRILKKIRVSEKWNLYPAVVESNGKLKDKVKVTGRVEVHAEGTYYIEWWEENRRKRLPVADRLQVVDAARRKFAELQAKRAGVQVATEPRECRLSLADAVEGYLRNIEPPQREPRTYKAYKHCLELFRDTCTKVYVQDVKREDLLAFIRKVYDAGCGPRTAYNRAVIVSQLLKANSITGLLHKRDWPDYVETNRAVYEDEELRTLFAACSESERTLYLFYLLTGMRDKEVRHVTWRDIDFRHNAVRVTAKSQWSFKPKNKEEREIPVPNSLLSALVALKNTQTTNPNNLVFPTATGQPDKKHENKLKKIAYRAGLNCGGCITRHGNRCAEGPHCTKWFLHKFRHTFATRNLQDHVCDIRTLQLWMGHNDLASTMVYLKGVRNKDVLVRLNGGMLASFATTSATEPETPVHHA